jgi:hypothetical protein
MASMTRTPITVRKAASRKSQLCQLAYRWRWLINFDVHATSKIDEMQRQRRTGSAGLTASTRRSAAGFPTRGY